LDGECGEGHGFRIRQGLEVLSSRQDMQYRVTFTFGVFSNFMISSAVKNIEEPTQNGVK